MGKSEFILDNMHLNKISIPEESFICFVADIDDLKNSTTTIQKAKEQGFVVDVVDIDGVLPVAEANSKISIFNRNNFDFFNIAKRKEIYFKILANLAEDKFLDYVYKNYDYEDYDYEDMLENVLYTKYDFKEVQPTINDLFLLYSFILEQKSGYFSSLELFNFMKDNLTIREFLKLLKGYKNSKRDSICKINSLMSFYKEYLSSDIDVINKVNYSMEIIKSIIADNIQYLTINEKKEFDLNILADGQKHAVFLISNTDNHFTNTIDEIAKLEILTFIDKTKKIKDFNICVFRLDDFLRQEKELATLIKSLKKRNISIIMFEPDMMFLEDDVVKVLKTCDEIKASASKIRQSSYNQKVFANFFPERTFENNPDEKGRLKLTE